METNHDRRLAPQIKRTSAARVPTAVGEFQLVHYRNNIDDEEHLALVMGQVHEREDVLTRVHSECLTGDIFGSLRCDCGEQLAQAMQLIAEEGSGVIVYLRQEGRGIGLEAKLTAYNLQDQGYDTVDANLLLGHQADEREYWAAAGILADLQVRSIHLLTNNPTKIEHLTALGVRVSQRMPLNPSINSENAFYLNTKAQRMRHMLDLPFTPQVRDIDQNSPQKNVTNGVISPAAATQIERLRTLAEVHFARTGLPFVTVSYAQSLDGSLTPTPGKPFPISGAESLTLTHLLRATHDGVLVGVGTMLADNPRLNVRLVDGPTPAAIIVDSHLRTPADARIFECHQRTWLATTQGAQRDHHTEGVLKANGVRLVVNAADEEGRVDLHTLLANLGAEGIRSVMVEGGAAILSSFLRQGLANYAVVTISPLLLGGLHALDGIGSGAAFPRLINVTRTEAGEDIILWGALHYPESSNGVGTPPSSSPAMSNRALASNRIESCTTVSFATPYQVVLKARTIPKVNPGELLIATEASAISPGSELLFYRGQAPPDLPADMTITTLRDTTIQYPISYGYACAGTVAAVGDKSLQMWLGRRVFAFYPHASHFTVAAAEVLRVPDRIEPSHAALLPNMETAVNFVMDGEPTIGERVAVVGQGVVGLMTTALLARFPLAELTIIDPITTRRQLGRAFGATKALMPAEAGTLGDFDLVYELSGNPDALDQAIGLAGYAGRVVIGSWYGQKEMHLNLGGAFHRSRIRLISSQVSTVDPRRGGRWSKTRRFELAWRMLAEVDVDALITHRLPVADAALAYELLDQRPGEALQVIFEY